MMQPDREYVTGLKCHNHKYILLFLFVYFVAQSKENADIYFSSLLLFITKCPFSKFTPSVGLSFCSGCEITTYQNCELILHKLRLTLTTLSFFSISDVSSISFSAPLVKFRVFLNLLTTLPDVALMLSTFLLASCLVSSPTQLKFVA